MSNISELLTQIVKAGVLTAEEAERDFSGPGGEYILKKLTSLAENSGRLKSEMQEAVSIARKSIPTRSGPLLQLPFAEDGTCSKQFVIETLKEHGIDPEGAYVRIVDSQHVQHAVEHGTDIASHAPLNSAGILQDMGAARANGITDRGRLTYAQPLQRWGYQLDEPDSVGWGFGDAVMVFRGGSLKKIENANSVGLHAFLTEPEDAAISVFHANAPQKAVPTMGIHTHVPEPPIRGPELPRSQQRDLPSRL
jgi:hypothetical protein